MKRRIYNIQGVVQGVGFRPFVYRLAVSLNLKGWVNNTTQGVTIDVEGLENDLLEFESRLQAQAPPHSQIENISSKEEPPRGHLIFEVRESMSSSEVTSPVLPDLATCPDCVREIFNPKERRYRYPFTNCTNCGPRFSIVESLPYDRPNTTMKGFALCKDCQKEYDNPTDRRFHAQPIACPKCGPHLELWDRKGKTLATHEKALKEAVRILKDGGIVALKGIGGFQLLVDARNEKSVRTLRERKRRDEKPFAVMYPSLEAIKKDCDISLPEERLLVSSQAPIVLVKKFPKVSVADSVAPENPYLGVMLPYSPLHWLLMYDLWFPVVATSANLSDEPICIEEQEALERLKTIADVYLVHNRPIFRHVDDSVVKLVDGEALFMRRARGYAPLPVYLHKNGPPAIAVGAHLKNTIAVTRGSHVFLSQYIGDLENAKTYSAFLREIEAFQKFYQIKPEVVVHDLHPDYMSTAYAKSLKAKPLAIQHHVAHVYACMAEHELEGPLLGVSWDGTGYGTDKTVWGGEFFRIEKDGSWKRAGSLRTFPLPGGNLAAKEPRRAALGLMHELLGDEAFRHEITLEHFGWTQKELDSLQAILMSRENVPVCSSIGRLFDAVASVLGIRQKLNFEGQAAMNLEFLGENGNADRGYEFAINEKKSILILDWEPVLKNILKDIKAGLAPALISYKFHLGLADSIVKMAEKIGLNSVALTGGCFQNKLLTELSLQKMKEHEFKAYLHREVPPNDGSIALGQIWATRL